MPIAAFLRAPLRPLASTLALPPALDGDVRCPGCEAPVPDRFCAACGEPRPATDLSVAALLASGVEHLTSLDVRLLRTIGALVTRPGFLTAEYRRGVRARYTRPLQLFLLVTALFFVAMPHMGAHYNTRAILSMRGAARGTAGSLGPEAEAVMRRTRESEAQFLERFERRADDVKRGLLALFVPALAGALAVLYARRRRYAVEHFVFATHIFSFLLVLLVSALGVLVALGAAGRLAARLGAAHAPSPITGGTVVAILAAGIAVALWYLWAALRRSYGDGRWAAAARAAVLALGILLGAGLYETALFRLTLALM